MFMKGRNIERTISMNYVYHYQNCEKIKTLYATHLSFAQFKINKSVNVFHLVPYGLENGNA